MSSSKQRLGVWQAAEGGVVVRVHRRQQADCCRVRPRHLTVLAEESLVAVTATIGSGAAARLAELRTSGLGRGRLCALLGGAVYERLEHRTVAFQEVRTGRLHGK